MSLILEAYPQLYSEKTFQYEAEINYTARIKPYNANVKLLRNKNKLVFSFSLKWKEVSPEIQIGLIQELLVKILRSKNIPRTMNMDLYNIFIKKLSTFAPKTHSEPHLEESFNRVNELYFSGMQEKPNLKWGNSSLRKLGCYEYASDTITISTIFQDSEKDLLDSVMYHEMLHKKLKYNQKNGRCSHHSPEFKEMERK